MIATHGVPKRGCTAATPLKKRPSSAIAKKTRGLVNSTVLSVPNVPIGGTGTFWPEYTVDRSLAALQLVW